MPLLICSVFYIVLSDRNIKQVVAKRLLSVVSRRYLRHHPQNTQLIPLTVSADFFAPAGSYNILLYQLIKIFPPDPRPLLKSA